MHRGFLTKTHKDQAGVMPLIVQAPTGRENPPRGWPRVSPGGCVPLPQVRGDSLFLVWSLEDGLKAGLTGGGGAAETPESEWEHEWLPPEEGGEEGGEPRPGAWRRFASMPSAAMARLWRGGRASGARGRRGAPACGTVGALEGRRPRAAPAGGVAPRLLAHLQGCCCPPSGRAHAAP